MRKQTLALFQLHDKKFVKYIHILDQNSFIKVFLGPVEKVKECSDLNLYHLMSLLKYADPEYLRNQVVEYLIKMLEENTLIRFFRSGQSISVAQAFFDYSYDPLSFITLIDKISPQGLLNLCRIEVGESTVVHLLFGKGIVLFKKNLIIHPYN